MLLNLLVLLLLAVLFRLQRFLGPRFLIIIQNTGHLVEVLKWASYGYYGQCRYALSSRHQNWHRLLKLVGSREHWGRVGPLGGGLTEVTCEESGKSPCSM